MIRSWQSADGEDLLWFAPLNRESWILELPDRQFTGLRMVQLWCAWLLSIFGLKFLAKDRLVLSICRRRCSKRMCNPPFWQLSVLSVGQFVFLILPPVLPFLTQSLKRSLNLINLQPFLTQSPKRRPEPDQPATEETENKEPIVPEVLEPETPAVLVAEARPRLRMKRRLCEKGMKSEQVLKSVWSQKSPLKFRKLRLQRWRKRDLLAEQVPQSTSKR